MPELSVHATLDDRPIEPDAVPAPGPNPRLLLALTLMLAAGTLWAMHGHVLRYPFLEDDYIFLTGLRRGLLGSIEHAIRSVGTYFRPLSRELWFWGMVRLSGPDPLAFHLGNFALLVTTIGMVAWLGARLAGLRAGLFAAAVCTLFYPNRVLLGYASLSQDLLAMALAGAAAVGQVTGRRWLAGALLLAGTFAKESIVPLPLVFTVWELMRADSPRTARWRAALRATLPSWIAVAAWGIATFAARMTLGDADVRAAGMATSQLALTPAGLALGARLTALTLVGLEQPWSILGNVLPAFPSLGPTGVLGLIGAAALALPALLTPRLPRPLGHPQARAGLALFGLVWLLVLAVPPVLLGTRFNAYYVALPAMGFAWCTGAWLARMPAPWPVAACVALALTGTLANGTRTFRLDGGDHRAPAGISIMTPWRLEVEAAYVRNLRAHLRAHPPERGTQLFVESPIGYGMMGTSGPLAPRLWLDDPTFDMQFVGTVWPDPGERPVQFARLDLPGLTFTPLPESLLVAIRSGSLAYAAGRMPDARVAFTRALAITRPGPHDWERGITFANLATVCEAQGDTAAARAAWMEAASLPTGRRPAWFALARLDFAAGRPQAAREWLRAGVAANPGDAYMRFELARAEHLSGDAAAAAAQWRQVIALAPGLADSLQRLGAKQ